MEVQAAPESGRESLSITSRWGPLATPTNGEAKPAGGGAGGRGACAPDPIGRLPARGGRVGSERAARV